MVRRKSAKAIELDTQLAEAVKGVKSGKYKLLYKAAKVLGLNCNTITQCIKGYKSCIQARYA